MSRNIRLGIFVIAGLLLLITGLYFIGNNRNMFGKTIKIYATFSQVNGLQPGNNVRFAGIDVGTVDEISILNDTTVMVRMTVDAELKNVIRKNSIATVGTDGLMGNKLVNIGPGNDGSPLVEEGDILQSHSAVNTDEMLRTLEAANRDIGAISANLKIFSDGISRNESSLYGLLSDTMLAAGIYSTLNHIESASSNLEDATSNLSGMLADARSGKGLLGTMIYDTILPADLHSVFQSLKTGSESLSASGDELRILLKKVNSGEGTAGMMVHDSVTARHLKNTIATLDSSAKNFNENMEALKHNFLLRGYFKKKEKELKKDTSKKK